MKQKNFLKTIATILACAAFLAATGCENELSENQAFHQIGLAKNIGVQSIWYIENAADMAHIGVGDWLMSDDYILADDIVLSNWTPIGTDTNPFTGTFDGGGNTITVANFDSDALATPYLGIFGYVASTGTGSGIISNLNVQVKVAQYAAKSPDSQYVGALAGYATGAAVLQNISVTGELDYASETRLYLGGIAGYLNGASLINGSNTVTTSLGISASSPRAIYAGGVVGYGHTAIITGVSTTSAVSISNGAVNTSAGGVSGYTVNTAITNCHATGAIKVSLQRSAMIYVGGLAGYAENGTITQCHAEGTVYALANYPYAGGLVGYNYMGNVISKCYATGSVSADGNNDLDDSYPYAGGLVGYNSGGFTEAPSTVEDCYATGDVSALGQGYTAWAGGIAGSNAREAVITRTYSTGAIEIRTLKDPPPALSPAPGAIAGGIAGYLYFGTPRVENSFALNATITAYVPTATSALIHRVVGQKDTNSIIGTNKANSTMVLSPAPASLDPLLDGTGVTSPPIQSEYVALGWDFGQTTPPGIWKMVTGNNYPLLQWQ